MNNTEAGELLRARRDLTGATFNDATITAWFEVLAEWTYIDARAALIRAAREHQRITVAHLVERLPRRPSPAPTVTVGHHGSCSCNGVGWIEILETGKHDSTYWAWARCPDGPPVAFGERAAPNAGPEMSRDEFLALHRPPAVPDDDDDQWARRTAWALFTDPACAPLKPDNPLAGLVEHYVNAYRAQGAAASPRTVQAP